MKLDAFLLAEYMPGSGVQVLSIRLCPYGLKRFHDAFSVLQQGSSVCTCGETSCGACTVVLLSGVVFLPLLGCKSLPAFCLSIGCLHFALYRIYAAGGPAAAPLRGDAVGDSSANGASPKPEFHFAPLRCLKASTKICGPHSKNTIRMVVCSKQTCRISARPPATTVPYTSFRLLEEVF